jgi:integrase
MADMGLRPGEVRALEVAHFDFGEGCRTVAKAVKGARLDSLILKTKTGAVRRVPSSERLMRAPINAVQDQRQSGGSREPATNKREVETCSDF